MLFKLVFTFLTKQNPPDNCFRVITLSGKQEKQTILSYWLQPQTRALQLLEKSLSFHNQTLCDLILYAQKKIIEDQITYLI